MFHDKAIVLGPETSSESALKVSALGKFGQVVHFVDHDKKRVSDWYPYPFDIVDRKIDWRAYYTVFFNSTPGPKMLMDLSRYQTSFVYTVGSPLRRYSLPGDFLPMSPLGQFLMWSSWYGRLPECPVVLPTPDVSKGGTMEYHPFHGWVLHAFDHNHVYPHNTVKIPNDWVMLAAVDYNIALAYAGVFPGVVPKELFEKRMRSLDPSGTGDAVVKEGLKTYQQAKELVDGHKRAGAGTFRFNLTHLNAFKDVTMSADAALYAGGSVLFQNSFGVQTFKSADSADIDQFIKDLPPGTRYRHRVNSGKVVVHA